MSFIHRVLQAAVFCLAGSCIVLPPVGAKATVLGKGACDINATRVLVSNTALSTTSTTFVNVTDSKLAFVQAKPGCVIVAFSAAALTQTGEKMRVQALLDKTVCAPSDHLLLGTNNEVASVAMNFLCPDVSAGRHTVQMQVRSNGGQSVVLDNRTTLLMFLE